MTTQHSNGPNAAGAQRPPTAPVTLIIVNWNGGALLQECLRRLEAQTLPPERIVIVDNDSTDGSVENIGHFARVTLQRMVQNLGFAAGNNRALVEAVSEFIALLNADAFPEPDWLERMLAAARDNPSITAFGSRQLSQTCAGILDGIGDKYHISGLAWRDRVGRPQQPQDLVAREIFSPCAAAALYRRQALLAVDGFDEDYFCYMEDVDLGFRLRLAGHRALYVPDAVVHHVGSATTGGKHSDFALYHGHRNLVWTFVKNMPGLLFWPLLPVHLLLNILTIVVFTLRGHGRTILRAKRDALKGLPRAWAKRQRLQKNRVVAARDIWQLLDKRLFRGR